MSDLRGAINMARFGDPVKAIEAFNRGARAAASAGLDDTPLEPGEHEWEIGGRTLRVVVVDRHEPS